SLQSVLLLLAASVIAVALCRRLRLPALIGYLVTGLALGPHVLGLMANREETQHLAEFGVVFLMFSIGLEFSLAKLRTMRRAVFGLGGAQVALTTALAGLSLVLGAFLAGMLISETEYRFQVEEDIKPYRDVLLGLFFITVGMQLDLGLVAEQAALVLVLFLALVGGKLALVAGIARAFGT